MGKSRYLYVALGDSITAGYSAPDKRGFATQLAGWLAGVYPSFSYINAGKKGLTSSQLAGYLTISPALRHAIRQSSLMTLDIGGNDLLYAYIKYFFLGNPAIYPHTIRLYAINLHRIYSQLTALSLSPLYTLNLYNPFPHSKSSSTWVPLLNRETEEVSRIWGVPVVNIYERFLGREKQLIHGYRTGRLSDIRIGSGGYPVHPNLAGHQVITEALLETIPIQKDSHTG
ncbi:SGNH/GDSL hydrolase family protein [Salinithrix halophila]